MVKMHECPRFEEHRYVNSYGHPRVTVDNQHFHIFRYTYMT